MFAVCGSSDIRKTPTHQITAGSPRCPYLHLRYPAVTGQVSAKPDTSSVWMERWKRVKMSEITLKKNKAHLRAESEARRGDRAPERLQGCRGFLVCFFTGFSARTEGGSDLRDQLTIAAPAQQQVGPFGLFSPDSSISCVWQRHLGLPLAAASSNTAHLRACRHILETLSLSHKHTHTQTQTHPLKL